MTIRLYCDVYQNITAEVINGELLKINQWLGVNKLSIQVSKPNLCFFHMHKRSDSHPDLLINGNKIERVAEFHFVGSGFTINPNLE